LSEEGVGENQRVRFGHRLDHGLCYRFSLQVAPADGCGWPAPAEPKEAIDAAIVDWLLGNQDEEA
jgi:hypothetical protein